MALFLYYQRLPVFCLQQCEFSNGDLFFNGIVCPQSSGQQYNFILRTDSSGNIKWSNWYDPWACCWGKAIACSDGGILSRMADMTFKTDSSGNVEWSKSGEPESFEPVEINDGFVFAYYGEQSAPDTGFIYKKIG